MQDSSDWGAAAASRTERVKTEARALGFDACAIADAVPPDPKGRLLSWLREGFHADMQWMANTAESRLHPEQRLPGVRSVIVLARLYRTPRPETVAATPSGRVSCYAWGRDYHRALRKPLRRLAQFVDTLEPGARSVASVDSAPVLEKVWAARAGLGWIGRNSLLIRQDLGSYVFLATVMTTVQLTPGAPQANRCGSCRACIDACPTGAILEGARVDSRRCISYHTIENRGPAPVELAVEFGEWVFGCDICQEVCPWNRKAPATSDPDFQARPGQANPPLAELAEMNEEEFRSRFAGTPLLRAKWEGIRRNAEIAMRNLGRRGRSGR